MKKAIPKPEITAPARFNQFSPGFTRTMEMAMQQEQQIAGVSAQHTPGPWYPVQVWTTGKNKKLTWAAWRDNGSGVSEMRGPSGKALRFRSKAHAEAVIAHRKQADHATGEAS